MEVKDNEVVGDPAAGVGSEFEEVEVEVTDDEDEEEEEEEGEEYEEVEYELEEDNEEEEEEAEGGGGTQEEGTSTAGSAQPQAEELVAGNTTDSVLPVSNNSTAVSSGSPAPASTVVIADEGSHAPTSNGTASAASSMLSEPLGTLKGLEANAAKAATEAAEQFSKAAMDYSSKLSSAFSAVSTTEAAPLKDAQESVSKLVGGFTSWWNNMDPSSQQVKETDEIESKVSAASKASSDLQKLFGLPDHENLVEEFKCKLLQTYSCSHNTVTPAIQMAFQGTLYITDRHTCFTVEERGRKLPFKVLHSEVSKVQRQRPARKGDPSDVLFLQLGEGDKWMSFKDFTSGSNLDSALALLEHLTADE